MSETNHNASVLTALRIINTLQDELKDTKEKLRIYQDANEGLKLRLEKATMERDELLADIEDLAENARHRHPKPF